MRLYQSVLPAQVQLKKHCLPIYYSYKNNIGFSTSIVLMADFLYLALSSFCSFLISLSLPLSLVSHSIPFPLTRPPSSFFPYYSFFPFPLTGVATYALFPESVHSLKDSSSWFVFFIEFLRFSQLRYFRVNLLSQSDNKIGYLANESGDVSQEYETFVLHSHYTQANSRHYCCSLKADSIINCARQ